MSTNPEARAWLQVRSAALRRNYARLRESVGPGVGVIPMVKADAYGLGMAGAVEVLRDEGPWGWGVATLTEGLRLRELDVLDPVVVFAPLQRAELDDALAATLLAWDSSCGASSLSGPSLARRSAS